MNKKYIIIALLILVIALLGWILFSGTPPVNDHKNDLKELTARYDSSEAFSKAKDKVIDSLKSSVIKTDSAKAQTDKKAQANKVLYLQAKTKAEQLAIQLKEANQDSAYDRKADSMVAEVDNLTYLYKDVQSAYDTLSSLYSQQKISYEQMVKEKDSVTWNYRSNYIYTLGRFRDLSDDFKKQTRSLKREKLKSKIAAALALIATGFMIAK